MTVEGVAAGGLRGDSNAGGDNAGSGWRVGKWVTDGVSKGDSVGRLDGRGWPGSMGDVGLIT